MKGDVRVVMALWWNLCDSGGSLGPEKAAAQASQMPVASSARVANARGYSNAVRSSVGGGGGVRRWRMEWWSRRIQLSGLMGGR